MEASVLDIVFIAAAAAAFLCLFAYARGLSRL
jgi:hypothetical protein